VVENAQQGDAEKSVGSLLKELGKLKKHVQKNEKTIEKKSEKKSENKPGEKSEKANDLAEIEGITVEIQDTLTEIRPISKNPETWDTIRQEPAGWTPQHSEHSVYCCHEQKPKSKNKEKDKNNKKNHKYLVIIIILLKHLRILINFTASKTKFKIFRRNKPKSSNNIKIIQRANRLQQ